MRCVVNWRSVPSERVLKMRRMGSSTATCRQNRTGVLAGAVDRTPAKSGRFRSLSPTRQNLWTDGGKPAGEPCRGQTSAEKRQPKVVHRPVESRVEKIGLRRV